MIPLLAYFRRTMSRTILSRLGAGLVAAALVAGGSLLVAAPASAVAGDETLVLANSTYTAGSWGEGVSFTGANYLPGATVEVGVGVSNGTSGDSYGSIDVVANEAGLISGVLTSDDLAPSTTLQPGFTASAFSSYEIEGEFFGAAAPIELLPFVPAAQNVIIDPICLSGDAVRDPGVSVFATGFGQFEVVTYTVTDAAGTVVPGDGNTVTADETGSVGPAPLTLFSTAGNIPDGVYTITFSGSVTTAGLVTIGGCDVPVVPAAPAAVAAAPQLANTGSSDAGILVGGSALLLLVGAALVVARRRTNAAA
jgi:LPXTG-motif cell wall-anchored protein